MPLKPASVTNIAAGKMQAMLDDKIRQAAADCATRPTVDKARVITLQISISPATDEEIEQTIGEIDFNVSLKLPGQGVKGSKSLFEADPETGEVVMMVNEFIPSELDRRQKTILDFPEKKGGKSQ